MEESPRTEFDGRSLTIVNEQLGDLGGTERVIAALLRRYPQATLFAPWFEHGNATAQDANLRPERTRIVRGGHRKHHFLAPVYARRLTSERLADAEVVIAFVHSGWTLAVPIPPGARRICYRAGPPRWLYAFTRLYLRAYPPLLRPALWATVPALRSYDSRLMARTPQRLVTNSYFSRETLARVYQREAEVVYPPVRTEFFTPEKAERHHTLVVARLRPAKRVDVVVEAFRGLDRELVVVGGGSELERLRANAPANVRFSGYVSDEILRELYRTSTALVCPSVEEFGIVMAEAQACGVPVIAPRIGGAREVVQEDETGILLERVEPATVRAAIRLLDRESFSPAACRASALRFSEDRFIAAFERIVDEERALAG